MTKLHIFDKDTEQVSQFKETGDENYIHFYGYDGKHLYVYRGVNLSKLQGKSREEGLWRIQ